MKTYLAIYKSARIEVKADSSYKAQQAAAIQLGVKEKHRYQITIVPLAIDNDPVIHDPAMLPGS